MRNWINTAIMCAALTLGASVGAVGVQAEPMGVFKFAEQVKLISLDPQKLSGGGVSYMRPVYETLLSRTSEDGVAPMLATGYEVDGLTIKMTLRDDVKFSDGTPFDAKAVVANLERAKALGVLAAVKPIDTVVATDDHTVTITLSSPSPSLLRDFTTAAGMMISPKALEDPELDRNPVGTGPFLYSAAESREGEVRVYTANPNYWVPDEVGLERVEIWELPDNTARLNALKTGQIDIGIWLSNPQAAIIDKTAGLKLIRNTGGYTYHLIVLDRDGTVVPAFADKRVRQAMNFAIDREAYSKAVDFGLSTPAYQPYPEGSWAHDAALGKPYEYNPDKARALLKEAGYENGFTFDMPSITIFQPRLEAIAGFLSDIGIAMNIVPLEPGTLAARSRTTDFPATNLVWNSQSDPSYLTSYYIKPGASFNPFRVEPTASLAKLSEEGVQSADANTRAPIYKKMAEELSDESYLIFVTSTPLLFGITEAVSNNPSVKYRPGEDTVYLNGLKANK